MASTGQGQQVLLHLELEATYGANTAMEASQAGVRGRWNIKGVGEGFQEGTEGKSYAIPTVTRAGAKRSIPLEEIKESISTFYSFASEHPDLEFLVAYLKGRNLNGYSHEEMMSVFKGDIPENVVFEFGFFDE